jgi:uncharacterized protein (DUF305 family)
MNAYSDEDMSTIRNTLRASFLLIVTALAACATGGASGPSAQVQRPESDPELERLEALYRARADSALMNVHEADVHFMTGMIHHHAQALVMSGMAPTRGASEEIGVLTARIINAQKDEIWVMQRWLRQRGLPVPEVDESGHVVGDDHIHMAGMLTQEQLDELSQASGREYDRLFLTYMIQHHNGAVTMVNDLFAADGAAQDDFVFKLASDIQADQTSEVARMQRMLDALSNSR